LLHRTVHILVSELSLSGHHANYLEHIAQLFLDQGHRVTLSVRKAELDHSVLARLRDRHPERLRTEGLPETDWLGRGLSTLGVVGGELAAWRTFRRFFKQLNQRDPVDRVFYPYLDYCLHASALLGPPSGDTPWAGICMRPAFHLARAGVVAPTPTHATAKKWLFTRLLHRPELLTLFTIDEVLEAHVRQRHATAAAKLRHIPDPAELPSRHTRDSARAKLGLDNGLFVILVYGAIDTRKGVDLLLDGLRHATAPRRWRVVTAGRHTPDTQALVGPHPEVMSIDRYIDDDTEEALFRCADLVWLGYRQHLAMSGVLVLAAAGVPVLATHNGLIGWMTRRHSLGSVVDTARPDQVAAALREHMTRTPGAPTEGMQRIRHRHTWATVNQEIEKVMNAERPERHVEAV
jgi:glycosyltransferase involved in cell wall biosynthesis